MVTLKERLLDAAAYAPDSPVPPALVADVLHRPAPRRFRQTTRLAAALVTACVALLWAARPVSPPPSRVSRTPILTPAPPVAAVSKARPPLDAVKIPSIAKIARVPKPNRPRRHFRRLLVRRVSPTLRRFSPRRQRLIATRPVETAIVKSAPVVPKTPQRRIVPIVVARLSDDGSHLILLPAAVVISPAAPTFQKE